MGESFTDWLKRKDERRRPAKATARERWSTLNREQPTKKLENEIYRRDSAKFKRDHPQCQFVSASGLRCKRKTAETHHRRGRGRWLLVKKWWMAVCWVHHKWIHANGKAAEALGYIVRDWNVPKDATLPQ